MTRQLNIDQLEKVAEQLPPGFSAKQTIRSELTKDGSGLASTITEVHIIGPGNHSVGFLVQDNIYRPSSQVSYWYIKQMALAGWQEGEMLDRSFDRKERQP